MSDKTSDGGSLHRVDGRPTVARTNELQITEWWVEAWWQATCRSFEQRFQHGLNWSEHARAMCAMYHWAKACERLAAARKEPPIATKLSEGGGLARPLPKRGTKKGARE